MSFFYMMKRKRKCHLKQSIADKDSEIQVLLSKIKELETRYANLKMARMISVNDNEIRDTKQRLTRLVREVDKCIALLNK